jgi:AraC-like DNA-binding protein
MDRDWLEEQLAAGRSLGDIAREIGRNPSTVSYWTTKFGLRSRYVRVYASRGGVQEEDLSALVDRGLSIRQIAAECGLSPTTIRHWLRRFGLRTRRASRVVRGEPVRECPTHGLTTFRRFGGSGSFRCPRCASARVARRRRQAKEILVEEAGPRMCSLRVQPVCRRPAVSSPRSRHEADPVRGTRSHARPRVSQAGGKKMRATVRQLPRGGRGRNRCRYFPR